MKVDIRGGYTHTKQELRMNIEITTKGMTTTKNSCNKSNNYYSFY